MGLNTGPARFRTIRNAYFFSGLIYHFWVYERLHEVGVTSRTRGSEGN